MNPSANITNESQCNNHDGWWIMMRSMEITGGGVPVLIHRAPENNGEGLSPIQFDMKQQIHCWDKL